MCGHALHPLFVVAVTAGMDVCSVPSNDLVFSAEELQQLQGHRARLFPATRQRQQLVAEVLPAAKALWQISDEHFAEALELPPGSSAVQGQNVAARGAESMQQGFTQILNNVEAVVPAATALAAIIANQTALASVLVTAYNHPSFGQPVCAHADAQDTFIFQLEGCRVWQFWHHSLEAKHLVHDPVNRSWELCIEGGIRGEHGSVHVELQPGAILWLPRGIAHQTSRCGKGVSSHWSFAASMSQLSAGHVLMDVAQASGKPEVQQKLIEALRKDNDLSVRLRQGHPSLEVTLALLDEVAPGPWPALDRRQVALRRKLLETAAGDLSMSQRTSQCRSGPLGKFLIRRKVGRRIDL
ncbi:unnamed protein product [Cladocopium goreaui]|uniref:Bifunctional lysine-specific demethylase and histidyl-hydroxylase NO66 n=1 Tax=Cladocopium goreaui TaxID=2562237 RepID=A0A9P1C325_9DINO|nr:unnamed protein product [Cladocopium goreaui]